MAKVSPHRFYSWTTETNSRSKKIYVLPCKISERLAIKRFAHCRASLLWFTRRTVSINNVGWRVPEWDTVCHSFANISSNLGPECAAYKLSQSKQDRVAWSRDDTSTTCDSGAEWCKRILDWGKPALTLSRLVPIFNCTFEGEKKSYL